MLIIYTYIVYIYIYICNIYIYKYMYGPFSLNLQYLHYFDVDAQVRMWRPLVGNRVDACFEIMSTNSVPSSSVHWQVHAKWTVVKNHCM